METSLKAEKPSRLKAQFLAEKKGLMKLIKAKENTAVKNIRKLDLRGR